MDTDKSYTAEAADSDNIIDKERLEKAHRRAREKGSFLGHIIIFIFVNLGIFIYNAIQSWGDWWFQWVILGWGIGIVVHFLSVYLFDGIIARYVDRQTEKELRNLKEGEDKY